MIAVRMRPDVEFEIVPRYAYGTHVSKKLIFDSAAFRHSRSQGVGTRTVRITRIFPRIDHSKMAVAFHENSIHIVVRHDMDANPGIGISRSRQNN